MSGLIRTLTPESTGWEGMLWWALRGAGGNNFGVVTQLTFAMEDAPPTTTVFQLHYTTADECAQALFTWAQLGSLPSDDPNALPNELGGQIQGTGLPPDACTLSGLFLGSASDLNKTLSIYTSTLAQNGVYHNISTSIVLEQDYLGGLNAVMLPYGGIDASERELPSTGSYGKSLMDNGVYNMTLHSARAVIHNLAAAQPPDGSYMLLPQFFLSGPGSATSRPPTYGSMSFSHTNNTFIMYILAISFPASRTAAYWDGVSRVTSVADAMKSVQPDVQQWQAYQNYMDPYLKDFGRAYYGSNLELLKGVKKQADPYNVLDFPFGLAHA